MKILLATFLYEPEIGGGASVVVDQLANLLVSANNEVVILTSWEGNQVRTEQINTIKVIRIPSFNLYWISRKDNQPTYKKVAWQLIDTWNPWVYQVCRKIFIREAPDVVHVHKLRGISPSVWSAASAAGIKKIVHTCHDFELLSPEGLLMGKIGRLAQEQSLVMHPYQLIRKMFSQKVHTATAPSRFVMDVHQKMDFFPKSNIKIVPNSHGLGTEALQNNFSESPRFQQNDGMICFLYIGRLDKTKGIDVLCQVFSLVARKNQKVILRIAGWGPLDEALREKYQHLDNIIFTGPVFGAQKRELFQISHVLVAPSVAPESFGIVIAEAFSYGMPVIASKIGAFPEIVREGETGFLVEPGSVEELAAAISRVSEEKNLIASMSENCFKEARKYTTEKMLSNYLEIYEEKS